MRLKKFVFAAVMVACVSFAGYAENRDHARNAIGLRAGAGLSWGPELQYQRFLGDANRLELGAGMEGMILINDDFYIGYVMTGTYQWWTGSKNTIWYAGPSAGIGVFTGGIIEGIFNTITHKEVDTSGNFAVRVGGQAGVQYDFSKTWLRLPLNMSFDIRPMSNFMIGNAKTVSFIFSAGLSARVVF